MNNRTLVMIVNIEVEKKELRKLIFRPFKPNNVVTIKVNRSIEIVIVPSLRNKQAHQENVGIIIEEKKILKILSKRYKNVIITLINTKNDLDDLAMRKPDLVFSGVKYFNFGDRKLWLNNFLDMYKIPYIASNKMALDNESDKNKAKKLMLKAKVKTANFFITAPGIHQTEQSIPIKFPLFVKPIRGGDSRGIDENSIVYDFLSFKKKVSDINNKQKISCIVETYLPGKEYSVGIFEDSINGNLISMPIEIMVKKNKNGHCILDYKVKKNDEEKVITVSDKKIFDKVSKLAKRAFKVLGGKSLGRIDIKMDKYGVPHFMEANLMPGLRKGYFFRSCVLNLKMSYDEMILNIANTGLSSR